MNTPLVIRRVSVFALNICEGKEIDYNYHASFE